MKKLALISALLLVILYSTAYAGKPPSPPSGSQAGYVMFNDNYPNSVIRSDGKGVYKDCSLGGTDQVEIRLTNTGALNYLRFYPGVMKQRFFTCSETYSERRIKFHFNVSDITYDSPAGADPNYPDRAVHEILRWYGNGYKERSTTPGFIDDTSLHAPIYVHVAWGYTPPVYDFIQFVIDPNPYPSAGTDPKAITQSSVDNFYDAITDNKDYWTTQDPPDNECADYIVYTLLYGKVDEANGKYSYSPGFEVKEVQWGKNKKPVTWIVKTNDIYPVRLLVIPNDVYNTPTTLITYSTPLPFEFAVSLNPISTYPSEKQAPPKNNTISTTWGEIKGDNEY